MQTQGTGVCNQQLQIILCMLKIGLYHFHSKIISFRMPHWLIMGRSRDWPDPRWPEWKIRDIQNVGSWELTGFQIHLPVTNVVALAVQRFTYDVIGQWPDMKMRQVPKDLAWTKGQLCQASALYSVFWAVAENPSGVSPPPGRDGLVNTVCKLLVLHDPSQNMSRHSNSLISTAISTNALIPAHHFRCGDQRSYQNVIQCGFVITHFTPSKASSGKLRKPQRCSRAGW